MGFFCLIILCIFLYILHWKNSLNESVNTLDSSKLYTRDLHLRVFSVVTLKSSLGSRTLRPLVYDIFRDRVRLPDSSSSWLQIRVLSYLQGRVCSFKRERTGKTRYEREFPNLLWVISTTPTRGKSRKSKFTLREYLRGSVYVSLYVKKKNGR